LIFQENGKEKGSVTGEAGQRGKGESKKEEDVMLKSKKTYIGTLFITKGLRIGVSGGSRKDAKVRGGKENGHVEGGRAPGHRPGCQ